MKFDINKKTWIIIIGIFAIILAVVLFAVINGKPDEPKPVEPDEPKKTEVNIVNTKAQSTKLVSYNNGDFSMKIPEGWQVEVVQGKNYGIRVYNPEDERYQIFYFYSLGGFLKSKEAKQYYQLYSGISSTGFEKLPILNPPTVENLYKTWTTMVGYAKTNIAGYANFNFPFFFNIKIKEVFELNSKLKETLKTKVTEGIIRVTYTDTTGQNGAEGMMSGIIVDLDNRNTNLPLAVYNVIGITTEETELINWNQILLECLGSIKFSNKYIESVKTNSDEETAIDINTEIQVAVNSYKQSWGKRQLGDDISVQKQKDADNKKQRVYDVNTGNVYYITEGWYKTYVGDVYKLISEEMYALPVVGSLE